MLSFTRPPRCETHRAVGEHRLDAEELGPGVAVAEHADAAGVGGDDPPTVAESRAAQSTP